MAVTTITTSMASAVNFTVITDTSADFASVSNNTYFYNIADKLVRYKDPNGVIQGVFIKNPSVQAVTSSATVTMTSNDDMVVITAQAVGLTLANPTGIWSQGQPFIIRIKDSGVAQTVGYGTKYRAIGVTLPTTTTATKTTYLGGIYNATDDTYDIVGVNTQA